MSLEELCIIIQDILPINENGVNCNWGVKQMNMVSSVGHLRIPWPQVVVTLWIIYGYHYLECVGIGISKCDVVNMVSQSLWVCDT
jgi:hypothetical protein